MPTRREMTLLVLEATSARNLEAVKSVLHPGIELESRFSVGTKIYRGHEGLRRWFADLADTWEYIRVEFEELVEEAEDTTVVLATQHAKGRKSGVEIDEPVAQRHGWRDDLISSVRYMDRADAEAIVDKATR